MIRTFSARLRVLGRSPIGRRRLLASDAGDTLIEVLFSALIVALIVVGTFTGLNSTNHATSIDRARSQADALAEQNEEQLHSLPVSTLAKLEHTPETKSVTQNGTTYTVTSSAKYVVDSTATTSCASTALSAEYIQTTSTVYSKAAFGATKPVVETGIVSPPPDTSLIVQVTNQLDEAAPGMEVHITGPSSTSAFTSANGCAILAVSPGEYEVNVHQTGYVDPNWFKESKEDTSSPDPLDVYLPAETTTKKEYVFALAAAVKKLEFEELNPTTGAHESARAVNAIMENSQMAPATRLLLPEKSSTYLSSIGPTEKHIFPFLAAEPYAVYAGTCSANRPPEAERTKVIFSAGGEESAKVLLPSLIVDVWQNSQKEWEKETKPRKLITSKPEIFLSDTDEGCENTYRQPETIEKQTETGGALKYPGQPWGTYTVCVNVAYKNTKTAKTENKYFEVPGLKNSNPKKEGTVVNLYEGGTKGEGLLPAGEGSGAEQSCP